MDPICHVAIVRLAVAVEDEARALTVDLGGSLYDHRMKLATGLPALILTTRDAQKARTHTMDANEIEAALYIFGPPRTTPWLLRQRHALYGALGAAVTAQSITNFERTLQELRTRAPHAGFKEGLATRKQNELDLLAHIVARTSGLSPP